jgi:signal transduction histidine kinase
MTGDADPLTRGRALAERLAGDDADAAALVGRLCDEIERARRAVKRVGLDLHDAALQDLTALRNDLQHFRVQIAELGSTSRIERVAGRVDDFLARVQEIDRVLRELVGPSPSSALALPLGATLEAVVDAYAGSGDVTLNMPADLDAHALTDSQRIAVVRIVQSALANVAQHSRARTTSVSIRSTPDGLEREITDDGDGFDVDDESDDRLGLSGMRSRVAMLGGEFRVSSVHGGPTTVAFRLPMQPALPRPDESGPVSS